ncbi:hypothetical protein BJ138DRAFT_1121097 [Hygrophoropsis aurantiaca]|uniref:Uncharacterized protein n=1 Tax=Hygrophoropsis aurantiaca TaxID=72124 RepID=A0ACB7ZPG2_9AGAM|nr:hypothetical protein BJ138DRAFT_1121097 [Hygrophoropsis aurantiaca]
MICIDFKIPVSYDHIHGHRTKIHRLPRDTLPEYVEVAIPLKSDEPSLYENILSHTSALGLFDLPAVYAQQPNQRVKGALSTASAPDESTEPEYCELIKLCRSYYHEVAKVLPSLSMLTLRAIASSGELQKALFRAPQELSIIDKYANFMGRFIVFLCRHMKQPLPNFSVILHSDHAQNLTALLSSFQSPGADNDSWLDLLHAMIFSLLTTSTPEFLVSEWKDLFTLFLVALHLINDHGNTTRVSSLVPPNISQAQWCFRVTSAQVILRHLDQFAGDSFTAYETLVKPYLTDGRLTLFTCLRQKMALLSLLAYDELTLPRFMWNATYDVLSIDGFPITLSHFRQSIEFTIGNMRAKFEALFRGCRYDDIIGYVASRTDPVDNLNWFHDHPQNSTQGSSVFNEPGNNFAQYSSRLIKHLARDVTHQKCLVART